MSNARIILLDRSKEIRAMQRYLVALDRTAAGKMMVPSGGADLSLVQNSIKAAFLMMLYNLSEAIVVSTIHEIFERVSTEALGYNRVASDIQAFWIDRRAERIRQGSAATYAKLIREAIDTALTNEGLESFDREEIRKSYAGNVDGRVIRDLADQFSINLPTRQSARGGNNLRTVKQHRNDLGHGIFSFSEVGRNYTAGDLRDISIRVRRFLSDAILAFEAYMGTRGYSLAPNASP